MMSQHFLLSPAARTLSLAKVMRMSDGQARDAFRKVRWHSTDGAPVCPNCGSLDCYDLATRQVYKCKDCAKQYSITSGTIFHGRKLPVRDILAAIAVFINGAKGYSALQLSRDLSVDYKTAFVLLHKVREAIEAAREHGALSGEVEVDGAYFGGYVKPANERKDRKDRRLAMNQTIEERRSRILEIEDRLTTLHAEVVDLEREHSIVDAERRAYEDALAIVGGEKSKRATTNGERGASRKRDLSNDWKLILGEMARRHPAAVQNDDLMAFADSHGIRLRRENLRSQMNLYKSKGLVEPEAPDVTGAYRITAAGAQVAGVDLQNEAPAEAGAQIREGGEWGGPDNPNPVHSSLAALYEESETDEVPF